jgi:hypothetical protein
VWARAVGDSHFGQEHSDGVTSGPQVLDPSKKRTPDQFPVAYRERTPPMKAQLDLATLDTTSPKYAARIAQYDWRRVAEDLDAYGAAVLPGLLSADDCATASDLFADAALSRMPPVEEMRSWGNGNYHYVRSSTPEMIVALRTAIYPRLAPIANAWNEKMEIADRYPITHRDYLEIGRRAGQTLPTSMFLEHTSGRHLLVACVRLHLRAAASLRSKTQQCANRVRGRRPGRSRRSDPATPTRCSVRDRDRPMGRLRI